MTEQSTSKAEAFLRRERTATALREAMKKYREATAPAHVDKYGFGFNESVDDGRWIAFAIPIRLQTHTGVYGRSDCSRFLTLADPNAAGAAFVEYLNRHISEILAGVADIIDKGNGEAKATYVESLRGELDRLGPTPAEAP